MQFIKNGLMNRFIKEKQRERVSLSSESTGSLDNSKTWFKYYYY